MLKKILISIITALTLGSTFAFSTATVSASHGLTQAQSEKLGYFGKAKTTKKITVHKIVHMYHAGKTRTIPRGSHIRVMGGVGKWNWIVTYRGRKYFFQHFKPHMKAINMINWFKEI